MKLTVQQEQVLSQVKDFLKSDATVFILRGYAGTGKTTLIQHIVAAANTKIILMAPTGRAAQVLSSKTGQEAATIHRTIYEAPRLSFKEEQDLAASDIKLSFSVCNLKTQVVAIVDEASMLTSRTIKQELIEFGTGNLMNDLLTFVRPSFGGKLICVGDPAQLPPVGEQESNGLSAEFFRSKGLKVHEAELTEVLRQQADSAILRNAMQIRHLLQSSQRNRLAFEEKSGEVEEVSGGELLQHYITARRECPGESMVMISYSNKATSTYNKLVRESLYGSSDSPLHVGEVLLVVQNNYAIERMNGEFIPVLAVGERCVQSAPVYVQEGGRKVKKMISIEFQEITTRHGQTDSPIRCMLALSLLNNDAPSLTIDEQKALYINFRMRHPGLKPGTKEYKDALLNDPFFTCLRAKYGYAVTGHKCQGGEWDAVFVDYSGRTGMSNDCLRWAYTATTRAQHRLYFANLPHITPFSRFRIEPVAPCKKINEESRILGHVPPSPFHAADAPLYLHAKAYCISNNMAWSGYRIARVESKPYMEIYYIQTPDGEERYDIYYKSGGIFAKAIAQHPTTHTVFISQMLDNEQAMPIRFDYTPTEGIHSQLFSIIRSSCDTLGIPLTNVVEYKDKYYVIYYFRTSGTMSYLQVYVDKKGAVTYAKPMSLAGAEDAELKDLLIEIQKYFQ